MVVLVNKDMSDIPRKLALDISERWLEIEPKNHVETALKQKLRGTNPHAHHGPAPMTRPAIVLDAPFALENYAGHYAHPAYGELVISKVKGVAGKQIQLQYGELIEPFEHWYFNTFIGATSYFGGEEMVFEVNAKGEIVAVTAPFEARLNGIQFNRVYSK